MDLRSALVRGLLLLSLTLLAGCGRLPWSKEPTGDAAAAPERPRIVVVVEGVEGQLADNVRASLSVGRRGCETAPAYVRALARDGEREALDALRALGHYAAKVELRVEQGETCPQVVVGVTAGPPTVVAAVDVDISGAAADDAAFVAAVAAHGVAPGDTLDHSKYAGIKQRIERSALERGYLDGRFSRRRLEVDPVANTARIALAFDSGPRYSVGEVLIEQDPVVVDEALIRRFLDYVPGEPYRADIVSRFYSALSASGYFSTVEVRPRLTAPVGTAIPIEIELAAGNRHRVSTGVGFSTDEGIRGKVQYQNRRFNVHGHRFRAEARASLIEQRLSGEYQIPRVHPSNEWFSVQGGVRREDVDTFETVELEAGIAETKRRPWGFMERRFVNLNQQFFDISSEEESTTFIIPGTRWTKTRADDPLFPRRGYSLDLELRGAADAILSDTSFVRALVSAAAVRALPLGTRLIARTDLGASWVDEFDRLPPTERFFAGGDVSIRGFDIDELGPEDDEGKVIGGRYLAVGSLEIEKVLRDQFGVAAFVDAGNAFGGPGSSDGVRIGAGLGLRWYSPVGPIRIDVAHPFDDDTVARLHLRIGPDL
ncbi:MAG: autotransporter assembly complex protein TamA [Gammaproteobacteria bacterium]